MSGPCVPAYGPGARARAPRELRVKHHDRRRSDSSAFVDRNFAEALVGATSGTASAARQQQRKARQFCRQVQRALNLALADRRADDGLNDLFVEEVLPAPDCGHLLVHVVIPAGRSVADVLSALRRDAPRLRSEVTMAITRKRAPELSFVPAFPAGGDDA
jgi:ribosome-binding factor A